MWINTMKGFVTLLMLLSLCACQPGLSLEPSQVAQSAPQVIIQGDTPGKEEFQTIEIDNCDGKSDVARTEQRSQSIDVVVSAEMAASLGASAEVISAEVQAAVGTGITRGAQKSTSIQLTAPPKTRMVFQLVWIGNEQIGIVQNLRGSNIPIAFQGFTPTDVRIKSQFDIGCPGTQHTSTPVTTESRPAPTQPPTALVCTGYISRREVAEWAITGEVSDPRLVKAHLDENFYSLKAGSWDFTDKDRIPAGVLVATDFGGRGETEMWKNYPLKSVFHYRSYGLFETTGEFVVPRGVTGQCLTITP